MKKITLTALLLCLYSSHLSAMEQRWQADLGKTEREKQLPKFPFAKVLDERCVLPGLTMEQSVLQTARHLIKYANTAPNDSERASFLTGYLKLSYQNTPAILLRSTYLMSENPMERLRQDLEEFQAIILNLEDVPQHKKSHASIWLARFLMNVGTEIENEQQQQETYLQAYDLLEWAHDHHATDVSLLYMAKLLIRHNLRFQRSSEGGFYEITDERAYELAQDALVLIHDRPKAKKLTDLLPHHGRIPHPQIHQIAPTGSQDVLSFQHLHTPYLSSKEPRELFFSLQKELIDHSIIQEEVQSVEDYWDNEGNFLFASESSEAPDDKPEETHVPVMDIEVPVMDVEGPKGILEAPSPQLKKQRYKSLGMLEENENAVYHHVKDLDLIGKEFDKKEWEEYAQEISNRSGKTVVALRSLFMKAHKDPQVKKKYQETFIMLERACQRVSNHQYKDRVDDFTPIEKSLLEKLNSLDLTDTNSNEQWDEVVQRFLNDVQPAAMEKRFKKLSVHQSLSEEQKNYCLTLARACNRINTSNVKKRKRDNNNLLQLKTKQQVTKRPKLDHLH